MCNIRLLHKYHKVCNLQQLVSYFENFVQKCHLTRWKKQICRYSIFSSFEITVGGPFINYITQFDPRLTPSPLHYTTKKSGMTRKIQNFKFGNFRFIFGTETGREVASLEWAGISRDGKWLVLNALDRKFSGKKFGTPKKRPGTRTSSL